MKKKLLYEYSHEEIAEKLNLTRGQVWHIEKNALKKIKKIIKDKKLDIEVEGK